MNFQEDLYDGFIDTRLYSCLNIQGQNEEKRDRFYDRNVIVAPAIRISRTQPFKKSFKSESAKTKRKRTKPIQDKAYYPPSDSDSAASSQQQQKNSENNPYTQNVPVYLYEHYDKRNKYLPKASRKVYKCKQKVSDCRAEVPAATAASVAAVTAPASPKKSILSEKESEKTDIVFVKEPHLCAAKAVPVESPRSPYCAIKESSERVSPDTVTAEVESEVKTCHKIETVLPNCADISRKLSEVGKQLQMLYEEQKKSESQGILILPSSCRREKDEQEETELKTVNINKSLSTRRRRRSLSKSQTSKSSVSKSSSRKTRISRKSSRRRSSKCCAKSKSTSRRSSKAHLSKSKSECSKNCKKVKSVRKVSSKSSKCSKRSPRLHHSKARKPSKTHYTPEKSATSIKHKKTYPARSLTIQALPPVAINPRYEMKKCTNKEYIHKMTSDGPCTNPCVCYQQRKSSKARSHHGTGSSYDYSDNYYSGTGAGYDTSSASRSRRRHSSRDNEYSGYDYYAGTARGNKGGGFSGGDGGRKRFMSKEAYCCDKDNCGFGGNPVEVGYATTIVTRFSKYTVYEILRPSIKRPASMCKVTENVFVVKNKLKGY